MEGLPKLADEEYIAQFEAAGPGVRLWAAEAYLEAGFQDQALQEAATALSSCDDLGEAVPILEFLLRAPLIRAGGLDRLIRLLARQTP